MLAGLEITWHKGGKNLSDCDVKVVLAFCFCSSWKGEQGVGERGRNVRRKTFLKLEDAVTPSVSSFPGASTAQRPFWKKNKKQKQKPTTKTKTSDLDSHPRGLLPCITQLWGTVPVLHNLIISLWLIFVCFYFISLFFLSLWSVSAYTNNTADIRLLTTEINTLTFCCVCFRLVFKNVKCNS